MPECVTAVSAICSLRSDETEQGGRKREVNTEADQLLSLGKAPILFRRKCKALLLGNNKVYIMNSHTIIVILHNIQLLCVSFVIMLHLFVVVLHLLRAILCLSVVDLCLFVVVLHLFVVVLHLFTAILQLLVIVRLTYTKVLILNKQANYPSPSDSGRGGGAVPPLAPSLDPFPTRTH